MGEARRRKERRRESVKPTERLAPLQLTTNKAVAAKQRAFCISVVDQMLEDESALSFSKPVRELWDMSQLSDYFEQIKNPMDLGTVRTNLTTGGYVSKQSTLFDPNAFRFHIRLVFLNAMEYNDKGTDLYRLSAKFLQYIDNRITELPGQTPDESQKAASEVTENIEKSDDLEKGKAEDEDASDEKSERIDETENDANDMKIDGPGESAQAPSADEDEVERLKGIISECSKHRARAEAELAELELMRNVPLSHDENAKLRDEVEALPWETAKKVVKILRKYVDEALAETKEEDPEFVTLEFSTVEPRLLRDIESLIRPDPRVEKERVKIENLNCEIKDAEKKLRKLAQRDHGVKKKPRRRR